MATNYKLLAKNLHREASFQRDRRGQITLATELDEAASAIETLLGQPDPPCGSLVLDKPQEEERGYNGDVVRQCAECEWCKDLEASNGEFYYFCMNAESGAFLEETGLLGNCTVSAEDEE